MFEETAHVARLLWPQGDSWDTFEGYVTDKRETTPHFRFKCSCHPYTIHDATTPADLKRPARIENLRRGLLHYPREWPIVVPKGGHTTVWSYCLKAEVLHFDLFDYQYGLQRWAFSFPHPGRETGTLEAEQKIWDACQSATTLPQAISRAREAKNARGEGEKKRRRVVRSKSH